MSFGLNKLFDLLPAVYRIRDAEIAQRVNEILAEDSEAIHLSEGVVTGPLKALLSIIAEQIEVLEEDLDQMYDDLFIETCAEWVVPYIGDLIGTRNLFVIPNTKKLSHRAQVANTLAYRRRKGTAAVLEQLAHDVTGWDSNAVEYFQLLATTQYMNHIRPENRSIASLRRKCFVGLEAKQTHQEFASSEEGQWKMLEYLNTPFDAVPRTVDVRNIERGRGKHNIPNIGIFLWRHGRYGLEDSPAFQLDDQRYLFDALGADAQLYTNRESEDEITHLAGPINVPIPISRRVLDQYLSLYYGAGKSFLVKKDRNAVELIPASPPGSPLEMNICVCDLSDLVDNNGNVTGWAHVPEENQIAVDPVLGRIAFPENDIPESVHVSYYYGFGAEIGGGGYERRSSFNVKLSPVVEVPSNIVSIEDALNQIDGEGVVQIQDHESYIVASVMAIPAKKEIELRSADRKRPLVVLDDELIITGDDEAQVTINGLLVSGGRLRVPLKDIHGNENKLRLLRLRHCTLLPGKSPAIDIVPEQDVIPRLIVEIPNILIEIDRCITGAIFVTDGAQVKIQNSIIDSTDEAEFAYAGTDGTSAGAPLTIKNSTVIGKVHTQMMKLASNTIFMSTVIADRLQEGCVRFSYVSPGSMVPRRYHCRPENAAEAARMLPQFNSLRYGDPDYCQLSPRCAIEIKEGADDQEEMGAFHDLYQAQRVSNLRTTLEEYLRFGLEAGIFFAN